MKIERAALWIPTTFFAMCAIVGLTACRGANELKDDFDTFLAENNACASASECTVIYTECPLGCAHAVRADRAEQVRKRADELVAEYRLWGHNCAYDCLAMDEPACEQGHCHVEPIDSGADAGSADGG